MISIKERGTIKGNKKIGEEGGFVDKGFNYNILMGYEMARSEYGFEGQALYINSYHDVENHINYFLSKGYDLIITTGYLAAQSTLDAALANPGTDFMIIDIAVDNAPANLLCVVFDVDETSFPCGFLAAYWAFRQASGSPRTGFVAGPDIPEVRKFADSYTAGIGYFNEKYQKNIRLSGIYADSFIDTLLGARLADSLIRDGASVIFTFARKTGIGALYKVLEAGKWAIGVDTDQYYSIPAVGPVLLTSCLKILDITLYSLLSGYMDGTFTGSRVLHANLKSGGVGLAPFHDYDPAIPDSIKLEINAIFEGIMDGSVDTGWK